MGKLNLNKGEFVISETDNDAIKIFMQNGVAYFFEELSQYINDNDDEGIVHYATERTMASLFVCGNLKRDETLTGVQEYGTIFTKDNKEVRGRPDIFLKFGDCAIWIECKYEKNILKLGEDHWDIPGWLAWDKEDAFSQVEIYYNSEKEQLNDRYNKRYLVTLYFKLIKENITQHNKLVKERLKSKVGDNHGRSWYYQVGFFPESENETLGMEVYGTFAPAI